MAREPFQITPDPDFVLLSRSHKEALASIIYGIEQRKGFVAIVGEVGVGKTTILRAALAKAKRERLKAITIVSSDISFRELLKTLSRELDLAANNDIPQMMHCLEVKLMDEYRQGRYVVLIIDEAQNMPVPTLENLHILSNLETPEAKLLQVVFSGQPEFKDKLNLHELRQLRQRIAVQATIFPLTPKESMQYLKYRLSRAGVYYCYHVFTKRALGKIVRHAQGIPRVINILCDNALITAYGYQQKPVNKEIVDEILHDLAGKKKFGLPRWVIAVSAVSLLTIVFSAVYLFQGRELSKTETAVRASLEVKSGGVSQTAIGTVQTVPVRAEQHIMTEKKEAEGQAQRQFPVKRTVVKGDQLIGLVEEVYGSRDASLVALVKQHNPEIKDSNKIRVGETLIFPSESTVDR